MGGGGCSAAAGVTGLEGDLTDLVDSGSLMNSVELLEGVRGRAVVGVTKSSSAVLRVVREADSDVVRYLPLEPLIVLPLMTPSVRPTAESTRLESELDGERSPFPSIGDGGTIVTLGKVLSESAPDSLSPSTRVVVNVGMGICSSSFSIVVGVTGGAGIGDGDRVVIGGAGLAEEGTLLRGALERADESDRSRVWVEVFALLTSLVMKLGAI